MQIIIRKSWKTHFKQNHFRHFRIPFLVESVKAALNDFGAKLCAINFIEQLNVCSPSTLRTASVESGGEVCSCFIVKINIYCCTPTARRNSLNLIATESSLYQRLCLAQVSASKVFNFVGKPFFMREENLFSSNDEIRFYYRTKWIVRNHFREAERRSFVTNFRHYHSLQRFARKIDFDWKLLIKSSSSQQRKMMKRERDSHFPRCQSVKNSESFCIITSLRETFAIAVTSKVYRTEA